MLKSYLGIATRNGLETFCPEFPETARFLSARASRLRPERAVLVWAVVADEAADVIREALRCGEKQAALRSLQCSAREGGHLPAE